MVGLGYTHKVGLGYLQKKFSDTAWVGLGYPQKNPSHKKPILPKKSEKNIDPKEGTTKKIFVRNLPNCS